MARENCVSLAIVNGTRLDGRMYRYVRVVARPFVLKIIAGDLRSPLSAILDDCFSDDSRRSHRLSLGREFLGIGSGNNGSL